MLPPKCRAQGIGRPPEARHYLSEQSCFHHETGGVGHNLALLSLSPYPHSSTESVLETSLGTSTGTRLAPARRGIPLSLDGCCNVGFLDHFGIVWTSAEDI